MLRTALICSFASLIVACGGGGGDGAPGVVTPPAALSYPAFPVLVVGTAINAVDPTVTGSVTSYAVSPPLPAGLTLDALSGRISGTPTMPAPAASYVVSAANSGGSTNFAVSITVNPAGELHLEPRTGTSIGSAQTIDVFVAYRASPAEPHPQYIDPQQVRYESSQPAVAVALPSGQVRGVAAGSAVITASYLTYSAQMPVTVAGTYVERSLAVAGQGTRTYSLFLPPGTSGARPLLLAIHGGGGTARSHASLSLLSKLGADVGAIIAYADGTGVVQTFNAGNCCGAAQAQDVGDVAYFTALIDDVEANYAIDSARVYATGFSNGGMMSYRLACAMSDRIAGIAAVGGASGQFDRDGNTYYSCTPAHPVRVLHLHAANDRNYPYEGGFGEGLSNTNFYPVDATVANWRERNNVGAQAIVENVTPTTTCYRYETPLDAGLASAPVALCKTTPADVYDAATGIVFGGGHSWPGGNRSRSMGSDAPVQDFSANAYLWTFLGH